jgi:hypothetical protein
MRFMPKTDVQHVAALLLTLHRTRASGTMRGVNLVAHAHALLARVEHTDNQLQIVW